MRKMILLLLVMLSLNAYSQEAITYTEVVNVDSLTTKKELFNRAKVWFSETYKDANKVIQLQDEENGQIIGKAKIPYESKILVSSAGTRGFISYTIKVFSKDGRYKYEITDFIHESISAQYSQFGFGLITTSDQANNVPGSKSWYVKVLNDIKSRIETNIPPLVESLKIGMTKKNAAKENW